ncbi:MAG: sulfatase-like hydrolase/transferase [Planctomycetales bacterium]|nr:sulfatase-like hydrolase/transferase [Planctomycetales bacterium]
MCFRLLFVTSLFALLLQPVFTTLSPAAVASPLPRPNILWLTSEDNGPELGCYGDAYADTPSIDRLASRGMIYLNAWSNAPVCAPARTTIISGMYPPGTGSQHMRSMVALPEGFCMFPQLLRDAGYYCTNNVKEDYNLQKPGQVWDDSSKRAHWRNRKSGQPFFAVFNSTVSHESQIRIRPHEPVHDAAKVPIPPYHPDIPEVRRDWAQYYDKLTEMDSQIGERLRELQEAGLAEDTIVFYYGDHGSGMPRSKRWLYQSGLRVPMVVYVPEKYRSLAPQDYQAGGRSDRLVGFIDLAPTVLSLAGVEIPENFQGHAFMGKDQTPPQPYLFGFRGRMDERIDIARCIRDKRFLYIRNYMPHKPQGQFLNYMFQTPSTRAWKKLYDEGKLLPAQSAFWEPKSPEELYDLSQDPYQIDNLASSSDYAEVLGRLRGVLRAHLLMTRDTGFLPEAEMLALSQERTPYEVGHDDEAYPLEEILDVADLASMLGEEVTEQLIEMLNHPHSAVRYWAAMGLLMRGENAIAAAREQLLGLLNDASPNVQIVAAEALARHGLPGDSARALDALIELGDVTKQAVMVSVAALGALDDLDEQALPVLKRLEALPTEPEGGQSRYSVYISRLLTSTLDDLKSLGR